MLKGDLSFLVISRAQAVHRELGAGFHEDIYQRALSHELDRLGIPHERAYEMPVMYKGAKIGTKKVDLFVDTKLMVELKALSSLSSVHLTQARNYLEAHNIKSGLLLNFGAKDLEVKRVFSN